jgi:hypothetical protein
VALGIGYITHIVGDLGQSTIGSLLAGDASQLKWMTYLIWPLPAAPPYPNDSSHLAHVATLTLDSFLADQIVLFCVAVGVWIWSGMPGLRVAFKVLRYCSDAT